MKEQMLHANVDIGAIMGTSNQNQNVNTLNRVRAASGNKRRFIPGSSGTSLGPEAKRYATNKLDTEGAQIRKNLAQLNLKKGRIDAKEDA